MSPPLFAGDDATGGDPIRAPSIRGALRFWFRAIATAHGITTPTELWKAEEAVFGSASRPSPIVLRIDQQPRSSGCDTEPPWTNHTGTKYLLGQGLWKHGTGLLRDAVLPGEQVKLRVRFSGDPVTNARFMGSLWCWLNYGGLGARVRRGFGQLRCDAVTGRSLPAGWTASDLCTPPSLRDWQQRCENPWPARIAELVNFGTLITGDPGDDEPLPEIPMLSERWWGGRLVGTKAGSWEQALHKAGQEWREFRAPDKPNPNARNTVSPEWTHVVRGAAHGYPVGALGMPVTYHHPGQPADVSETVDLTIGDTPIRRASPVWLRPVEVARSDWRVFSHVFYARLIPEGSRLRLSTDPSRNLTVPDPEGAWDNWLDDQRRVPPDYHWS